VVARNVSLVLELRGIDRERRSVQKLSSKRGSVVKPESGVWTPDLVSELIEMLKTQTGQEVSDTLAERGIELSRSAIHGKMNRLGVSSYSEPGHRSRRKVAYTPGIPRNVPFVELERGECKYECSGSETTPADSFVFCGNPVRDDGEPYCGHCASIAYRPV
jgi:hypothetical protein